MIEYTIISTTLPSVSNWLNVNYRSSGFTEQAILISELKLGGDDIPMDWKDDYINYGWTLDKFTDIHMQLNDKLSILDEINSVPELRSVYQKVSNILNPYYSLKGATGKLSAEYNAEVVTNAWLKMYEICTYLKEHIIYAKKKTKVKSFKTFHLAEAPGNFMLAVNHWIDNNNPAVTWEWAANSYRDLYNSRLEYLVDTYGLMKRYPQQWKWGADGDGDITASNNIRAFSAMSKVHMVTGDVKYVPSNMDYNYEENINIPVVFGQFLSSLFTLKKGGILVNKMFTFNEPATICMMMIGAYTFDKFLVTKPVTSRPANTEIYIVGIGYKDNLTKLERIILLKYMEYIRTMNTGMDVPAIFKLDDIEPALIDNLYDVSLEVAERQMAAFDKNISMYNAILDDGEQSVVEKITPPNLIRADQWIKDVGMQALTETHYMR